MDFMPKADCVSVAVQLCSQTQPPTSVLDNALTHLPISELISVSPIVSVLARLLITVRILVSPCVLPILICMKRPLSVLLNAPQVSLLIPLQPWEAVEPAALKDSGLNLNPNDVSPHASPDTLAEISPILATKHAYQANSLTQALDSVKLLVLLLPLLTLWLTLAFKHAPETNGVKVEFVFQYALTAPSQTPWQDFAKIHAHNSITYSHKTQPMRVWKIAKLSLTPSLINQTESAWVHAALLWNMHLLVKAGA